MSVAGTRDAPISMLVSDNWPIPDLNRVILYNPILKATCNVSEMQSKVT